MEQYIREDSRSSASRCPRAVRVERDERVLHISVGIKYSKEEEESQQLKRSDLCPAAASLIETFRYFPISFPPLFPPLRLRRALSGWAEKSPNKKM